MKKRNMSFMIFWGSILLIACIQPGAAQNRDGFSLHLENDFFAGTDRYYTNGMKFTWITSGSTSRRSDSLSRRAVSVSIGQNIYTPYDINLEDLIEDDRPYAGISYFTLALHKKEDRTMNTWEFLLGIVGPSSLAEELQSFVHGLLQNSEPKGWQHQLKDEIVFGIIFDRKWRIFRSQEEQKFGYDFVGHAGGSFGTMITAVATGWQFRFGLNLPRDFGTFLIRPGGESGALFNDLSFQQKDAQRSGVHGFVYLVGHGVIRNIFLDGNTYSDSHRVDKYPFVSDIAIGFVISLKRFKISYAYVYRTKQFKTQDKPQIFGAINISYVY
ncbi:MAG: lipid A deacylase LpxR family protein [Candidatus Aminicenantes bacterium]|nr:MAG: lipid A deacylase LpxR family protein [Candidatus Aminicenantes bacterium]